MRKLISMLVLFIVIASGCSKSEVKEANVQQEVVNIKENMFIAQINDIYANTEEYLGRTINYEGIFGNFIDNKSGFCYYYVIRYGPGCCGNDANAGFEVLWDGEFPNKDDWVEVEGVLEKFTRDTREVLRIRASKLEVKETRGEETVMQ